LTISGASPKRAGRCPGTIYAVEKRQALDHWAEHVRALVDGLEAKVIPFPARAIE
jgi:hypothetical protein